MIAAFTAKNILALLLLAVGVADDLRSRKVHNQIIIFGLIVSLIYLFAFEGFSGALAGLISAMTALVAILPMYLIRALGGGDVKLFVVTAFLMPWQGVLISLFASLVWGSLLGILQILLKGEFKILVTNLTSLFLRVRPQEQNLHKIPYTVALLFGFLTQLSLQGVL